MNTEASIIPLCRPVLIEGKSPSVTCILRNAIQDLNYCLRITPNQYQLFSTAQLEPLNMSAYALTTFCRSGTVDRWSSLFMMTTCPNLCSSSVGPRLLAMNLRSSSGEYPQLLIWKSDSYPSPGSFWGVKPQMAMPFFWQARKTLKYEFR